MTDAGHPSMCGARRMGSDRRCKLPRGHEGLHSDDIPTALERIMERAKRITSGEVEGGTGWSFAYYVLRVCESEGYLDPGEIETIA